MWNTRTLRRYSDSPVIESGSDSEPSGVPDGSESDGSNSDEQFYEGIADQSVNEAERQEESECDRLQENGCRSPVLLLKGEGGASPTLAQRRPRRRTSRPRRTYVESDDDESTSNSGGSDAYYVVHLTGREESKSACQGWSIAGEACAGETHTCVNANGWGRPNAQVNGSASNDFRWLAGGNPLSVKSSVEGLSCMMLTDTLSLFPL